MPKSKALDVVVNAQQDYLLPSRKTYIPRADELLVTGMEYLCSRNVTNSVGVLMVANRFTLGEYVQSEFAHQFPPHCLTGGFSDYDPPGVQNVFSQQSLTSRGLRVFHLYKQAESMWHGSTGRHMAANVHEFNGTDHDSMTLLEFINDFVRDTGCHTVNIWGACADTAVAPAIRGWLNQRFKVNVIMNLCRHREVPLKDLMQTEFKRELDNKTLVPLRWEPRQPTRCVVPA